eukprot:GCRY01002770.1.p1 GENE.GCRY01002770.1~~GCRY01002770.1.p1  ORF type:complete len:222 (+),score=18.89 GCRY01002770.1:92-757(+)
MVFPKYSFLFVFCIFFFSCGFAFQLSNNKDVSLAGVLTALDFSTPEVHSLNEALASLQNQILALEYCSKTYENSTAFHGGCYLFVDQMLNWTAALDHCQTMNMFLSPVLSKEENIFLGNYFADYSTGTYWLGLKANENHEYFWSHDNSTVVFKGLGKTGTSPNGMYTNWYGSEPNNAGGHEYCGEMWCSATYPDYFWNDNDCVKKRRFVCWARASISSTLA